jgi:hypothetical protein
MNPFWKTILTTLLGAVSLLGARYSANWIANHTYRANRPQPAAAAQMMRPVHWPAHSAVTVPNYFKHSAPDYPIHPYRSRH